MAFPSLPTRTNGSAPKLPADVRQIVIIGANGAGKTRFTRAFAKELGPRAFGLSALNALYSRGQAPTTPTNPTDAATPSIDTLYADVARHGVLPSAEQTTQLDRLLGLLMHDEMLNLITYKVQHATDPSAALPATRLDKVIELWREIFPDNKILIESGKFLFTRGVDPEGYSALKLSAGEKAIIYYLGCVLYAPENGVLFIDSPEIFLHPSITSSLWNRLEQLRPDCTFVYTTHDLEFASTRTEATIIWVRDFDPQAMAWDYDLLPPQSGLNEELYMTIMGSRKPVLFIEGDGVHSIDAKLYPLVFKDYTVKSLGSCNRVIEATRTFNDLNAFHHLDSYGIVDRDRRDAQEVDYLRRKKVMVPDVAEIENILMLEEVVRAVAAYYRKNEDHVFQRVRKAVLGMFRADLRAQALQHTRHRVKRLVEYRIDGRFTNINMLEQHMADLPKELNPRGIYEKLCREFTGYSNAGDYQSVLRVYNQKSMLPGSNVAGLCGLSGKDDYLKAIIAILREDGDAAARIRRAIMACFGIATTEGPAGRGGSPGRPGDANSSSLKS